MSAITIPIPPSLKLTSNQRLHWARKSERSRQLRRAAFAAGLRHPTMFTKQHCTVLIDWPDKRRRDAHNWMPTVKPLIDGLVSDAGLLPDDSDQFLVGPDLRVSDQLCDKRYAAVLHITFKAVS